MGRTDGRVPRTIEGTPGRRDRVRGWRRLGVGARREEQQRGTRARGDPSGDAVERAPRVPPHGGDEEQRPQLQLRAKPAAHLEAIHSRQVEIEEQDPGSYVRRRP